MFPHRRLDLSSRSLTLSFFDSFYVVTGKVRHHFAIMKVGHIINVLGFAVFSFARPTGYRDFLWERLILIWILISEHDRHFTLHSPVNGSLSIPIVNRAPAKIGPAVNFPATQSLALSQAPPAPPPAPSGSVCNGIGGTNACTPCSMYILHTYRHTTDTKALL